MHTYHIFRQAPIGEDSIRFIPIVDSLTKLPIEIPAPTAESAFLRGKALFPFRNLAVGRAHGHQS